MAMVEVPVVVGEAMVSAFDASAAATAAAATWEAEVAALELEAYGLEAAIAVEEAALAASVAEEGVLLGEEVVEAAAGPFGWIPMLITAGVAAAVAISIAVMQSNINRMNEELGEKRKVIESKRPKPSPPVQATPPVRVPDVVAPGIHDVLASFPNGPVVDNFELFNCKYNFYYSRCRRRGNRKFRSLAL